MPSDYEKLIVHGKTIAASSCYDLMPAVRALLSEQADAISTLLKEKEKLEEALKRIAVGEVGGDPNEPYSGYKRCGVIALEALKQT
jgi:hypothetical protein